MFNETASKTAAKPRGRPFQRGNSGRPRGARNKTSAIVGAMLEGYAEPITAKLIELACGGDRAALRLCIDRLLPVRADQSISIPIPKVESASDGAVAQTAIVEAVARGEITPNDGLTLSQMIATTVHAVIDAEFERRLAALEKSAAEKL
jgi:hypothetical protein